MAKYTLLIDTGLYEELSKIAGQESIRRRKSILWSKLAREILADYAKQYKSPPPVPEKRCQ